MSVQRTRAGAKKKHLQKLRNNTFCCSDKGVALAAKGGGGGGAQNTEGEAENSKYILQMRQ